MGLKWFVLGVVALCLASCGNNVSPTPPPYPPMSNYGPTGPVGSPPNYNPNSPNSNPDNILSKTHADVDVAGNKVSLDREDLSACLLDSARGEVIVSFRNEAQGTSLSVRLSRINIEGGSSYLTADDSAGNLIVSLRQDDSQGPLTLRQRGASCGIQYALSPTAIQLTFRCENLTGRDPYSPAQEVTGELLCPRQASQPVSF